MNADAVDNMDGEQLAKIYCGTCHLKPDPQLLGKDIWRDNVLPYMSYRLGISDPKVDLWKGIMIEDASILKSAKIFPEEALIDSNAWNKIVDYYLKEAPDTLSTRGMIDLPEMDTMVFSTEPIEFDESATKLTTSLFVDTFDHSLIISNALNQTFTYHPETKEYSMVKTFSPVVNFNRSGQSISQVLLIGIMFPNDQRTGQLVQLAEGAEELICIDNLQRPVYASYGDLNADGMQDAVISSFGNFIGSLSWWENLGNCQYEEHVLINHPGAQTSHIIDFNRDGLPDIASLFGQGREGIYIHYNIGKNKFRMEPLVTFDPVFGSTYFEFADFNSDGNPDILYTNGDNADFSYTKKPYHGIRIFRNDEGRAFTEIFFYPMYGTFKAQARDYDKDGDLDIAAISFFPDFESDHPVNFVYLENQSTDRGESMVFKAFTIPNDLSGRWLTMESADLNGDDWLDIVLGSFTYSPTPVPRNYSQYWESEGVDALILWNIAEKHIPPF